MNHANAVRLLPGRYETDLCITPGGKAIGAMLQGELFMPAELAVQIVGGRRYLALVVWVDESEIMRCGNSE